MLVETLFGDRDLVAVADGMGGHAGGEVASEKALETLLAFLESSNDLSEGVRRANEALLRAAEENPEWKGMGTTLVALLRVGDHYHVANVGDSRAYRLDPTGIDQITADHSFTAEAISSGRLSEDEAERSPWRNALTRAVGTDKDVHVDVFGPFPLNPPHLVVLCTDGLYRVMSDAELAEEVLGHGEHADSARNLVADALRRGSNDNISVAVVEFGDLDSLSPTVEVEDTAPDGKQEDDPRDDGSDPERLGPEPAPPATVPEPTPSAVDSDSPSSPDPSPSETALAEDGAEDTAEIPHEPTAVAPNTMTEGPSEEPGPYRPARQARVGPSRDRKPPERRRRARRTGMPPWVRREFVPAILLIAVTLALVFVISSVFS